MTNPYKPWSTLRKACAVGLVVIIGFWWAASARAMELRGRATSSLYASEVDGHDRWRSYLGWRSQLELRQSGRRESLTLHNDFRWSIDLANTQDRPQTDVRQLYLDYQAAKGRVTLSVGRRYVYNSLAGVLLDGGLVRYRPMNRLSVELFGGSWVTGDITDEVRSLTAYLTLGGRLRFDISREASWGLNWLRRADQGDVAYHRAGTDVSVRRGQLSLYVKAAYDVEAVDLADLLGRVTADVGAWYMSAEYRHRQPSVSSSSLFSLIDSYTGHEVRFDASRKVLGNLAVTASVFGDLVEGENTWYGSAGIRDRWFSLLWHHQEGYGGDDNRLVGFVNVDLDKSWAVYSRASVARYRVQEEQVDRSDAYSVITGVQLRTGGYYLRSECQYLRNAVDASAWRLMLNIQKAVRLGDR